MPKKREQFRIDQPIVGTSSVMATAASPGGGTTDHNQLQNLTVGHPHTQYTLLTTFNTHDADAEAHQSLVTISTEVDTLFSLTDQALDFDTITANYGLFGPASGGPAKPTIRAMVEADLAQHDIVGTKHSVTGSALDVVGLSASDTLGVLTPEFAPGANEKLLKTNSSGYVGVERIAVGLGTGVSPSNPVTVRSSATTQVSIQYDASNTAGLLVGGGGDLIVYTTPGDIVFRPGGKDVRPFFNYDTNLGTSANRYLALYAAELWVQTLVAQDVLSTIGGRILVGPTTELIADVGTSDTTIDVKHNQIASGDIVYLQTAPGGIAQIEAMKTTSGATSLSPGYRYSVTRAFDGSPANSWVAGDAVFNTGQTGDGFIDIFAEQGVHGSGAGPTIIGNVRTGVASFGADIAPRWAIGNLNGTYGVGSDTYGIAFGDASGSYLVADASNGIRVENPSGRSFWVKSTGEMRIGGNVNDPASLALVVVPTATSFNSETLGANDVLIGDNSTNKPNFLFDKSEGKISVRNGKDEKVYIDGNGFRAGLQVLLNQSGLQFSGSGGIKAVTEIGGDIVGELEVDYSEDVNRFVYIRAFEGEDTGGDTSLFLDSYCPPVANVESTVACRAFFGEFGTAATNRAQVEAYTSQDDSFILLGGAGNYRGVTIRKDVLSAFAPDTRLDVIASAAGEGIKIGDSFIGVGGFGSAELFLSHWDYRTSTTSHALRANSSGDTLVNVKSGRTGHLTSGNVSKLTWTDDQIRIVGSSVDFKFEGDLIVNRGGTDRTAYLYVPLPTAKNITGWNNRLFTDAAGANEHGANDDGTGTFTPTDMGTPSQAVAVEMRVITAYERYEENAGNGDWSGKDGYIILGSPTDRVDLSSRFLVEGTFSSDGGTPTSGFHESAGLVRADDVTGNVSWEVVVPPDSVDGLDWTEYYIHVYVYVTGYFI